MKIQQIPTSSRRFARAVVLGAAVVGSIAFAASARAQGQDPQGQGMDPRKMLDQRMARLTETLKLDSAQEAGVRWILAGETMDLEELRKKAGDQRAEGGGGEGGGGGRGGMGGRRGGGGGDGRRGDAPPDSTSIGDREGSSGSPEVRAIRDRADKQIEKLLNPEQVTIYRQMFERPQQRPAGDSASRRGTS